VVAAVDRIEVPGQADPGVTNIVADLHGGGAVVHLFLDADAGAEVESRTDLPAHAPPVDCAAGPVTHGVGALGTVPHFDPRTVRAGHGIQALRNVLLLSTDVGPGDEEPVRQSVHRDSEIWHHARG